MLDAQFPAGPFVSGPHYHRRFLSLTGTNAMAKYVYFFGGGKADGRPEMNRTAGRQGGQPGRDDQHRPARAAGFTITTEVCTYYYANDRKYPPELRDQVDEAMQRVEKVMGAKFGDAKNPLLVSCRSAARDSMPGMMDTVLNIGLNDQTVEALAKQSGNERFAWDSYRRFVQMYGDVVLDMKPKTKNDDDPFEEMLDAKKKQGRRQARQRTDRRAAQGAGRRVQDRRSRSAPARTFPTTRWSRCGARSAPCSAAG